MQPTDKIVRGNAYSDFLAEASDGEIVWQFMAIAAAIAIGLLTATVIRRLTIRKASAMPLEGVRSRLIELSLIELPFVLALFALLIARTIVAALGSPATLLDLSMQLVSALILVRLGLYLLRLALGERSWLRIWETRLTLTVWLLISFELVGWLDAIESGLDSINLLPGTGHITLWSLIKGLVIITLFVLVTSVIARAIERRVMHIEALALSTRIGISKFTFFFLVSLGVLLGINAAGVDLTALTVLTGAIGLGLGFGLQSIASNFVSGFVLLMDRSIKPGDVISFTGQPGTNTESFGWVQALRGRYVVVRDRDGVETLVPNQNLITSPVINWSYSDRKVRLKLPVRVSYRDDPEQALTILSRATEGHPRILRDPAPVTRLMQFSDHGMDLELRFWISDPESGVNNVRSDINREIWRLFRDAGITIPVAQREVIVRSGGVVPLKAPTTLPEQDLEFQFVRATGPGGQNVNKVATAAQLRFNLAGTRVLTAAVKARLRALAGKRVTADGDLLIVARNHRTQEGNRRDALERLMELIARASIEPIKRKATRPTHGSKLRRLDSKRERKQTKRLRGRVGSD